MYNTNKLSVFKKKVFVTIGMWVGVSCLTEYPMLIYFIVSDGMCLKH